MEHPMILNCCFIIIIIIIIIIINHILMVQMGLHCGISIQAYNTF
jgi:hypothetical protein